MNLLNPVSKTLGLLLTAAVGHLSAQTDSLPGRALQQVYVTEVKPTFATTSRNVTALTNSEMQERGAQTLADALATLPGVNQVTTGAIARPVIRGLYGNRLQINVGGLRLEDQQWEDEQGLGLSDVGVERVELIKGPAALLYGSDAMGGVINVVETDGRGVSGTRQRLHLKAFSNTRGLGLDYGLVSHRRHTWTLNAGAESHGDYSDGSGQRIPNTRFALYTLKTGFLVRRNRWTSDNHLLGSFSAFGFITDTANLAVRAQAPRLERAFDAEHHKVLFGVLSSRNAFKINDLTTLNATLGVQNNLRQEEERGNRIDLNLLLTSASLNVSLQRQLARGWSATGGLAGMWQTNRNYGGRIIVPDAKVGESAAFGYLRKKMGGSRWTGFLEAGLRYDRRRVTTHRTGSLNLPGADIPPFSRVFDEWNGALGQSVVLGRWVLKADFGTGFRAGNLSELAANGLHEGTPNWYIGRPDLKVEQCFNTDLSATWQHRGFSLRGSVFNNRFFNYIYLDPTGEQQFGFNVYRYRQTDATLRGVEVGGGWEKSGVLALSADYSLLDARRDDGSWLPFTPANRLIFNGKYFFPLSNWQPWVSLGGQYAFAQNHPAAAETATPDYWLWNAGAGVSRGPWRLLLTVRNATNTVYNDHLSRYKYLGVRDPGRNVVLNLGWQF